ncbi:MAG: VWA domain-containing protein [Candidatus Pacebacteria bacterium]|jgi:hypothetical protein|nr:VWA domain-containing protein [Candidatus Paceibacterota bacterium]MBT4359028.1 VWA domain-containing protein [Candidatus Paceibacterota bacterium]MBT4681303.1 VWA domain-containing protein [Candidatus Paceibacterota bacterium]MBT6898572.1 VWA domain-containing protein [Candidatus Paceibacterota bacterium]MBT7184088.1 VWA domain-containing protein [Candidatus Paceibacterota bacterium]
MDNLSPLAPTNPPISPPSNFYTTTPTLTPESPPASISTPPASTSTPPASRSPKFIIIAILLLILVIGLIVGWKIVFKKPQLETGSAPTILQKVVTVDLSRYDKDTDQDGYPDFIESELGLNPNISEYDSCNQDDCDSTSATSISIKRNVLIILDASGSMALGGSTSRMEIAKQAIKSYVGKASSNTNIGLMIYGHHGSNKESDKPISCNSAEVISQIGKVNASNIDTTLSVINPVGWTPMGYALTQANSAFVGKENDNNEIILLSDGEETCSSNPAGAASTLKNSSSNILINVIGFAVDANAQAQLNQISTSGGGTFATANNLTELDRKFADLYENGLKKYAELKCATGNLDTFRTCYNNSFNQVMEWVQQRKLLLYDKKITEQEYTRLDELSGSIYTNQKNTTNSETQDALNKFKTQ